MTQQAASAVDHLGRILALAENHFRQAAPVFPGETQVVEMWREDDTVISFRVRIKERNVVSINNGKCTVKPVPDE